LHSGVIAGLDPATHHLGQDSFLTNARVKPAHDEFAHYFVSSANAPFQSSGGGFF
jgi:hypothetical protein